jgi:hypothetical protein
LTFVPGVTSETIQRPLQDDSLSEDDEEFNVTLSNASNALLEAPFTAEVTLTDNDPLPVVGFTAKTISQGENSATVEIEVSLTPPAGRAVSVDYATIDGTATAGADYVLAQGTLIFAPGETSQFFELTILQDTLGEGNETVNLTLNNAIGAQISADTGTAILTIQDDEAGVVGFDRANYVVAENVGSAIVTVTLTAPAPGPVTVNYATSNNSALAGSDYTAASGQLTFAAGQSKQTIMIPVLDDSVPESNETFNITLNNPTGVTLGTQATATLTILDNDPSSSSRVYLPVIRK